MSKKKELSLEVIEKGLRDSACDVRAAAMNACQGKDVPLEVIEKWLRDSDWRARAAAMNACQHNGITVPVIRTFEPPKSVFKSCMGGVIVEAVIPADAQVRGAAGRKCRTNKATITAIHGAFCGEKVGVAHYDRKTTYFVGDEIEVENFDYSDAECSAGFHFFCTREEAEEYGKHQ